MKNYNLKDLLSVINNLCSDGRMNDNIMVRTNNQTIIIECNSGNIFGRVYKLSEENLDEKTLNERLNEIWDNQTKNNLDSDYPELSDNANRIRVSRERDENINEILKSDNDEH